MNSPSRPQVLGLRTLSVATVLAMALSLALDFFYAPLEAEQGFLQKIFYVHVPLAIVALCGFVLGGLLAIQHLRTRDPRWDMRSYVVIHMSLIFAVGTLITGSIWAKGSWGHWWVWSEPTLVSFLIIFLLYATYQPLRFAIEDPVRQSRYASVFAITAGAFVPLNYVAVNEATAYVHPRVFSSASNLPGSMALTLLVAVVAIALLFATLCSYELTAKRTRAQVRALRRRLEGETRAPRAQRSAVPSLAPVGGVPARAGAGAGATAANVAGATNVAGRPAL
ncbi:MAG TPA: cytochrome c biogenesis protein CcsA [Solirubrobacteraceae bacterium]|nr:cytochrome c biogenesis protein CcsA [Solirubrobacteraceae bacterium]